MNKRHVYNEYEQRLLDANSLCAYINLGKANAIKLAEDAGAKIKLGKRALYDKKILDAYIDSLHE